MKNRVITEYIQAEENNHSSTVWKFTELDRACSNLIIRGIWIFDAPLDVGLLKAGLRKLLCYYPHLSGRMNNGAGIQLTNRGIPFTVVEEPELTTADVVNKNYPINRLSTKLGIWKIKSGFIAPMSIKITRFKNGSVLGIQCFHACMDGYSFYTMVKNWGKICKKEDFEKPVLDQSLFPLPEKLTKKQAFQFAIDGGWKILSLLDFLKDLPTLASGIVDERTDPFYFSADALKGLKQKVSSGLGIPCSTNIALSAFLSEMCIKLYGHTQETRCTQVTIINGRQRLAGIPATFVGNSSALIPTPNFPSNAGVNGIAKIIHDTLEPILKKPSPELLRNIILVLTVLPHRLPVAHVKLSEMYSRKPTVIQINNFAKLPIYDVDFGSGKPVKVIPHNLLDPILIWPAHPSNSGVEVYYSGIFAHSINKLSKEDHWLQEILHYSKVAENN